MGLHSFHLCWILLNLLRGVEAFEILVHSNHPCRSKGAGFHCDAKWNVHRRHHHNGGRPETNLCAENASPVPPVAYRDEDRMVYFGKKKKASTSKEDSTMETDEMLQDEDCQLLMDPPIALADPYGWMRDDSRSDPAVLDHIHQENQYTTQVFQPLQALQQELVREYYQPAADEEDDGVEIFRVSLQDGKYYDYTKRLSDQSYPVHCRTPVSKLRTAADDGNTTLLLGTPSLLDDEQVVLDESKLVQFFQGAVHSYFAVHSVAVRPSNPTSQRSSSSGPPPPPPPPPPLLVAVSVDNSGDESYEIHLFEMNDKGGASHLMQVANNTSGRMAWARNPQHSDNGDGDGNFSLHFVTLDSEIFRPYRWSEWNLLDHTTMVHYTEEDDRYWGDIVLTSGGQYILWTSESSTDTMTLALDVNGNSNGNGKATSDVSHIRGPTILPIPFQKYYLDHGANGQWWVLNKDSSPTNINGTYYRQQLYTATSQSRKDSFDIQPVHWPQGNEHEKNPMWLDTLCVFPQHLVVQGRQNGLQRIWIVSTDPVDPAVHRLEFSEEAAHHVCLATRQDHHSNRVLLTYESMITPPQVLEVDLRRPSTWTTPRVLYNQALLGYDKTAFGCQRHNILARDGVTMIPVSLVYRKLNETISSAPEACLNQPRPLHLLGYGAYGHSLEPSFSTIRLPLLNRGVVCAVAHVRGGGEWGSDWYVQGTSVHKQHSMDDFVDVAEWLIDRNWTTPSTLAAEGRSAGGLLVASAMNQRPSLFRCVVLGVPFVDILNTLADASLPLTSAEREEWGNPHTQCGFDTIKGYAPMHNVVVSSDASNNATTYPSCLLMGGWVDPRVSYWEPLKFAAQLRYSTMSSLERPILVKINTNAGHSFGADRSKYFDEMGFLYAFILSQISS